MTDKQLNFIRSLVSERELPTNDRGVYVAKLVAGNAPEPNVTQSSAIIDWLLNDVPRKPEADAVPAGRYAVEIAGKLRFFRVDTPTDGKWKGRTFLNEIFGGDFDVDDSRGTPIRSGKSEIFAAIAAEGLDAARGRFGREIGKCGCCGRTLTDEVSRASGIGPDCAEIHGIDREALIAASPAADRLAEEAEQDAYQQAEIDAENAWLRAAEAPTADDLGFEQWERSRGVDITDPQSGYDRELDEHGFPVGY